MVARGTYGNPWIFGNAARLRAGAAADEVTVSQRLAALLCHIDLLEATDAHLARARSLSGWYLRGVPNAAQWRERAMHCSSVADYHALVSELAQELEAAE
jgi:tRNA-dihydrouridine synthase